MISRIVLLLLLVGLLGSRWDGKPIVAKTIETKLYHTGDATLVVDVARGVLPEDLLGRTMLYGSADVEGYWEAVIYRAEWSGEHIRIMISPKDGPAPREGEGAVII